MKEPIAVSSPSTSTSPSSVVAVPSFGTLRQRLTTWPTMVGAGFLLAFVVGSGAALGAYHSWNRSGLIAPNVSVAGEPLGGLTPEQATQRLEKRFSKLALTLKTDERNFVFGLRDIGGKPSIQPTVNKAFKVGRDGWVGANFLRVYVAKASGKQFMLPIEWKRGALVSQLQVANRSFAKPPRDARLLIGSGGIEVRPEQQGKELDITKTADQIQKSYFVGMPAVAAVVKSSEPHLKAADLQGRDVQLGRYRTTFNPGLRGRTTNIRVACEAIEGRVLMPGESFSFNESTGERTWDKGYRMAHIFERKPGKTESEVVDGLAGGVCQVSSTLYNAVRKANDKMGDKGIRIVERNSHSLPVTYVPTGLDATVAWPYKDFRFRNTLNHPVYLRTNIDGSRLTIEVWGRVPA